VVCFSRRTIAALWSPLRPRTIWWVRATATRTSTKCLEAFGLCGQTGGNFGGNRWHGGVSSRSRGHGFFALLVSPNRDIHVVLVSERVRNHIYRLGLPVVVTCRRSMRASAHREIPLGWRECSKASARPHSAQLCAVIDYFCYEGARVWFSPAAASPRRIQSARRSSSRASS
jgi:hypothetical protein